MFYTRARGAEGTTAHQGAIQNIRDKSKEERRGKRKEFRATLKALCCEFAIGRSERKQLSRQPKWAALDQLMCMAKGGRTGLMLRSV